MPRQSYRRQMIGYDLQSCQQFQQTLAIYETLYIHNILHTISSNVINVDIASQCNVNGPNHVLRYIILSVKTTLFIIERGFLTK